jgi:hypothetical protein
VKSLVRLPFALYDHHVRQLAEAIMDTFKKRPKKKVYGVIRRHVLVRFG